MRVIVVGAGKLGYTIADLLSREKHEVVVVDHEEEQLIAVKNNLDVLTITANGASPITMDDPDVNGADILIAVTASDEAELLIPSQESATFNIWVRSKITSRRLSILI